MSAPLRVGYVPEHFSTPLHFAQKYFSLNATLIPFPSGTGHMIQSLAAQEIEIGIGLTEGWVAELGKKGPKAAGFSLVGTYVDTPLCWAISTGIDRPLHSVADLQASKVGVSRIGSGSYIMSYVLADAQGWLAPTDQNTHLSTTSPPFTSVPLQTFANLRAAVTDCRADFFMWEHFTSKRYYSQGPDRIKKIGEIYTPWSSWKIVASVATVPEPQTNERLAHLLEALDKGVKYFEENQEEAVEFISGELDYSAEDAREWLGTVKFTNGVKGVKVETVEKTIVSLKKAGVLDGKIKAPEMIGVSRDL